MELTTGCRDVGEKRNGSFADESTTFNLGLFKTLGCNSRENKCVPTLYPLSYNLTPRPWDTVVFTVTRYELNCLRIVVRFLTKEKEFFFSYKAINQISPDSYSVGGEPANLRGKAGGKWRYLQRRLLPTLRVSRTAPTSHAQGQFHI